MRRLIALAAAALAAACAPARAAPAPFSDWAAVVVAGDDHGAHGGAATQTFDDAARDIAAALMARGFTADHLRRFSLDPASHPGALKTDPAGVFDALKALADKAAGGCLVYITSHGTTDGVVVGAALVAPRVLAAEVARACGARPTVVVVSACFSGVFVPALAGPSRMVLTAARRDRSSFGCSEADRYPFFDQCVLESFPAAGDFTALGPLARACVARREAAEGARPASQPQISIGAAFPKIPFAH